MATSNLEMIGHEYPGETFTMTEDAARGYAAATDDSNPRYPAVAPPLASVMFTLKSAALPVMDEKLMVDTARVLKLLHGEQEMRWHRLVKPGDVLSTKTIVKSIQDKGTGELIEIDTHTVDAANKPAVDMTWGFFIRGTRKDGAPAEAKPAPDSPHAADFEVSWTVAKDQSLRYAAVSGDGNPIHTDDAVARMAGLNGVILHGLCTMAFAQRALIEKTAAGDPGRLARMKVRFAKPVYPGETLITRGWNVEKQEGRTLVGFEVRDAAGALVLKDCTAEIR